MSRSRHTEPKINGPSRGTWFETETRLWHNHLCKVLQALGTVVATVLLLLLLSNSKVFMLAVAIPKAAAVNFSFLNMTTD